MDVGDFMRRALELAEAGLGRVWPNPSVGAVVVRDGEVVGEARTQKRGRPHAEVVALRAAGDRAAGATMFVSLEPCSHWGRTPPCTEAIVDAGIARVVIAIRDPDPRVDGRGIEQLAQAGIAVEVGLEAERAAGVNAGFFSRVRLGRPLTGLVAPPADAVPEGYDARLTLADDRWSVAVAVARDPLEVRVWRFAADAAGGLLAYDETAGSAPPEAHRPPAAAVLATLGHEGLTRVAIVDGDPAAARLRANDLLDGGRS